MRPTPLALRKLTLALCAGAALASAPSAYAQQANTTFDGLLEKLKDKGVLTQDEYDALKAAREEEIQQQRVDRRARALKEAKAAEQDEKEKEAAAKATKFDVNPAIRSIQLFGDVRTRFESRTGRTDAVGATAAQEQGRERERYAVRLGIRGDLTDRWYYGLRLETNTSPRSTWVTFGGDTSSSPSDKTSDGINVGQAYVGWRATDWLDLVVGRQPNPFFSTSWLVWDPDINPEGLAQKISYPLNDRLTLFGNFGQFVYRDLTPDVSKDEIGFNGQDAYLLGYQVGATYKFTGTTALKAAATYYQYNGRTDAANGTFMAPGGTLNTTGINDLAVLQVPVELSTSLLGQTFKVYGEYATNFKAGDRARKSRYPNQGDDKNAYTLGVGIGQLKKKGDWEARAFYQYTEVFAVDPNLVDSDLFDSRVGLKGWYAQGIYNFTDAIYGRAIYGQATRINKSMPTPGTGTDISLGTLDDYKLLQLDLGLRF
jgi:hypothetical protein